MLEAAGLRRTFGTRVALDGIDLAVRPGTITGLLGPNGAGKTTFMRIALGVLAPDAGEVRITQDGRSRPVTVGDRRQWGYMPQERGLYPAMPAGEQLIYFGRLHGLSRADASARARALLDEVGLADRWADRTDRLSGGMQQRLQLGTALMHDPELLVLDEPHAGLDPVAAADLSRMLEDRTRAGCTVLLSSHQLDLVQDLCEDIVMIDNGRVVLEGRVGELRASAGRSQLRLGLGPDVGRDWLAAFPGVLVVEQQADALRLDLPLGTDPLAVLDAARAAGPVTDFGLDLPTLSQLFLHAAGGRAA